MIDTMAFSDLTIVSFDQPARWSLFNYYNPEREEADTTNSSEEETIVHKQDTKLTPLRVRNDDRSRKRRKSSMASLAILQDEVEGPSNRRLTSRGKSLSDRFVAAASTRNIPLNVTPRSRRLAKYIGEAGDRRLSFHSENVDPSGTAQNIVPFRSVLQRLTRSLYEIPAPLPVASASANLGRAPETCLAAPCLRDDFYSRLADWSKDNLLAVAMSCSIVYRNMQTQSISRIVSLRSDEYVSSTTWNPNSSALGIGFDNGLVRTYNPETKQLVTEYKPHREKDFVGDLSWRDTNVFAVGYQSGQLRQYDIREQRGGKVLRSHRARVCGVKWNPDGRFLATGGGDGVIACWDSRCGRATPIVTVYNYDLLPPSSSDADFSSSPDIERNGAELSTLTARWRMRRHVSTVKAFAWCPWEPDMLASGGGTKDGTIRFWDVVRGRPKRTVINTHSQITSLHFSQSCREIVSTHGYAFAPVITDTVLPAPRKHSILVHNYPRGDVVGRLFDAPHGRITHSCLSPDGTKIVTCGSDDSIRIYKVFGKQEPLPREDERRLQNIIR
ncbi:hypothetical protein ACEPAH_2175 [Sanghuangporus vaninii]